MNKTNLTLLSCLVVFNVALTTDALADNDTKVAINVPASASLSPGGIALNLGGSLTLTQNDRQLDIGVAAGKGIDGPTLSANLHAGLHTPGARSYILAGYRFARYTDTSEFDYETTEHVLSARLGIFLPKSGRFRLRLEGELGIPVILIEGETSEDNKDVTYFDSIHVGVSLALSYSFR